MIDREVLAGAIAGAARDRDRLTASLPVVPLPGQVGIVRACVAAAGAAGLDLPSVIAFEWRDGPKDAPNGSCALHEKSRRIVVYLNANQMPDKLRETTYHELMHVSDFYSGEWDSFTRIEREERAISFASDMLRCHR